jgi:hypothetical protein
VGYRPAARGRGQTVRAYGSGRGRVGFSDRLEAAIARYPANAVTTAQVIEELIQLANDVRAARSRGEETGLTDEEIAFYDALAENESARQVMGEPALRDIAHELVASIKSNVSVDWMHREAARARMRVLVKRLQTITALPSAPILSHTFDFMFYASIPLAFALSDPARNALAAATLIASFLANGGAFRWVSRIDGSVARE